MKKLIFGSLIALLVTTGVAHAARPTLEERQARIEARVAERDARVAEREAEFETRKTEIKAKIETRKTAMENRVGERKAKLDDARKVRVTSLVEKIGTRFEMLLTRFKNIDERLTRKIDALDADGKDVSSAESALDKAQEKLENTRAELAAAQDAIKEASAESISKELVRDLFTSLKASVKETHDAYKVVVVEIQKLRPNDDGESDE